MVTCFFIACLSSADESLVHVISGYGVIALPLCLALTSGTGLKVYGIEGYGPLASSADVNPVMATGFGLLPRENLVKATITGTRRQGSK